MNARSSLSRLFVCVCEKNETFSTPHTLCVSLLKWNLATCYCYVCVDKICFNSPRSEWCTKAKRRKEKRLFLVESCKDRATPVCVCVCACSSSVAEHHRRRRSNWQTCTSRMSIFRHSQRFVVKSLSPCLAIRKERNSSAEVNQHSRPINDCFQILAVYQRWNPQPRKVAPFAHLSSCKKLIATLIRKHELLFFTCRRTNRSKWRCYLLRLTFSIELERKKSRELFDGWISKNVIRRGRRGERERETQCMLFSFSLTYPALSHDEL